MASNSRPRRSLVLKSDFNRLRESGRKMSSCRWLTIVYGPNKAGYLRYGFSIPRQVGSAVLRNRLRRWGREIVRQQVRQGEDLAIDVHFLFRPLKGDHYQKLQLKDLAAHWAPKPFPKPAPDAVPQSGAGDAER